MAHLTKPHLLARFEDAVRASGWNILFLSSAGEHPARYRIYNDEDSFTVRVYIWNISHGGASRPADEFRIQVTGLSTDRFEPEPGGRTLILGYSSDENIFAGFDYSHHGGPLGGSPSFQIGLSALQGAAVNRFATYEKNSGELAMAFRPDFMVTYIRNPDHLHETGKVAKEVALLNRIAEAPDKVGEQEISENFPATRQWAVASTRRALRALDFSDRIMTAYSNRCAMCGVQLRLLDGAHILPVADPESTDETANGIALCALHHRAYDRGIVTFDVENTVHVSDPRIGELKEAGLHGGLDEFQKGLLKEIYLPTKREERPKAAFVKKANTLRGWSLGE
jgi:putative restriction endonuclease